MEFFSNIFIQQIRAFRGYIRVTHAMPFSYTFQGNSTAKVEDIQILHHFYYRKVRSSSSLLLQSRVVWGRCRTFEGEAVSMIKWSKKPLQNELVPWAAQSRVSSASCLPTALSFGALQRSADSWYVRLDVVKMRRNRPRAQYGKSRNVHIT